jgi:hypothetical protein
VRSFPSRADSAVRAVADILTRQVHKLLAQLRIVIRRSFVAMLAGLAPLGRLVFMRPKVGMVGVLRSKRFISFTCQEMPSAATCVLFLVLILDLVRPRLRA